MGALSPEAIFVIQVSDFLSQISDVTTQLVVPRKQSERNITTSDFKLKTLIFSQLKQLYLCHKAFQRLDPNRLRHS